MGEPSVRSLSDEMPEGSLSTLCPKRFVGRGPGTRRSNPDGNQRDNSSRLDGRVAMTQYLALRVYTVPEGKLEPLTVRFRDHAHRLFARHGLDGLGYWVVRGSEGEPDKLAYLLAAPSREQYESSWAAFRADPEWQEVRRISERDGRLVAKHEEFELEALDFSAIR